ncbi:D-2-hydroxyacid dehydrogenase [Flammeovirga sp. SJP92]|uniref:D-2-hydroxyacid dehydrogenase n=1 Tax=Flammeovirga sp. SJP92 TaxID=1775430 RepID=UPI0007868462|nr:D-2-hydroxyacid dehydrogenase [Flammeovirga sp. SJP92]KXX72279.1 hydroxyacid dehydrogenase [Flammeovirga sp. SJP92]
MGKIVFLDTASLGDDMNEELHKFNALGEVVFYDATKPEQTKVRIQGADVIVTNKVVINEEMMKENPQLKLITITATGMNNVDLVAAEKLGIKVKNAVNYSSESVAQQTFAMLLSLLNHIQEYDCFVKEGNYSKSASFTWIGQSFYELKGKTYGIFGMGNIGKRVAEIATAFGAHVIYYSTSGEVRDERFELVSAEDFFKRSDVVSIHAPLNEKTLNAIATKELGMMKNNAIIVNVGRGGIVDEKALAVAIDEGQIAGAAVDVFVSEPTPSDSPLMKVQKKEKLMLSPHIAWASKEARAKLLSITFENVKGVIAD